MPDVSGDTEAGNIAQTLHRMVHQVDTMARQVAEIHADWATWKPVIEAYNRGGMVAARTALGRIRKGAR